MASIGNDPNGTRRILFVAPDGKRKTVRLGKRPMWMVEAAKRHVEHLVTCQTTGRMPEDETMRWLDKLDDELRDRLAAVGLTDKRGSATLGTFVEDYISKREGVVKPGTLIVDRQTQTTLCEFFGPDKSLREITEGDAEDFRNYMLTQGYAEATTRKRCSIAGKIMRYAVKHRLIESNPFEAVPTNSVATEHLFYVEPDIALRVLDQMPSTEWKLLFALSRWGGLRIGSEVRTLTWADIDWARQRMTIHSVKTERHAGHAERVIPIFPQVADLLSRRFEEAEEGDSMVLPIL